MAILYVLLSDGAKRARRIIEEFKPRFESKKEYLDFVESISSFGERIKYCEDNRAEVVLK